MLNHGVFAMADYLAPFHAPQFTDAEFEEMKRKYVEKHGYTVTVPVLNDIIHLAKFPPLTDKEAYQWKYGLKDEIPEERRAEIQQEKDRKKAKFLAMLADPSPKIARDAAAILTAIDDVQDAVSTLACIGMVAAVVIGGPVAATVLGPLGLILGASQLLNMINPMSRFNKLLKRKNTGRLAKKNLEKQTNKNPFSKKAKLSLARRLKKFRPTLGNALEALQVTDNVYGVGISLGPIMGFIQSSISGVIRTAQGDITSWEMSKSRASQAENAAAKALIANCVMHSVPWHSDVSDETLSIIAASLGAQVLYAPLKEWNPLDHIDDIGDHLIECPQPTDPLTIEILEETGFDFEAGCTWPQNGERWISIADLQKDLEKRATTNLRHYGAQNAHSLEAFNALAAADDFAMNFLAIMGEPEQIKVDYLHIERIIMTILDNGWVYPEDIAPEQIAKFEDWCYVHEYMNTQPSGKDIWNYAEIFCGFKWVSSPDELR